MRHSVLLGSALLGSVGWLVLQSAVGVFAAAAQTSDCANYWINPRSGKAECLDRSSSTSTAPTIPAPAAAAPTTPVPTPSATPKPTATAPRGSIPPAQVSGSMVQSLDRLKACQPYAFTMDNPLFSDSAMRMMIKGKVQGRCLVEYYLRLADQEWLYGRCRYRPQTLALLTDAKAYREARQFDQKGNLSISVDMRNRRDRLLSQGMQQDCQFYEPPANLRPKTRN